MWLSVVWMRGNPRLLTTWIFELDDNTLRRWLFSLFAFRFENACPRTLRQKNALWGAGMHGQPAIVVLPYSDYLSVRAHLDLIEFHCLALFGSYWVFWGSVLLLCLNSS